MSLLNQGYSQPLVSPVALAVARASGVPVTGGTLGVNLAEAVRALDSENGGDFTVTMLDATKASRRFSDFTGTAAGDGDSLALWTDDVYQGALGDDLVTNGSFDTDTTGWTLISAPGSSQAVVNGRLRITIGGGDVNARSVQTITTTVGQWYYYTATGYQGTSDASPQWKVGTSAGNGDIVTRNFGVGEGNVLVGYFQATTTTTYITVQNNDAGDGEYAEFDDVSVKQLRGRHAYQATAGDRPILTTNAVGRTVVNPNGVTDHLDLPAGTVGDGTDYTYVFSSYAFDSTNSVDSSPTLLRGSSANGGFISRHTGLAGTPELQVTDGASAGSTTSVFSRVLSSNETIVRADFWQPGGEQGIRINGADVARDATTATADASDVASVFGNQQFESLAGTVERILIIHGATPLTAAQIRFCEQWCAEPTANDMVKALLNRDYDYALSRLWRPLTDLNVEEGFATADWDDSASVGSSDVTVTPGVGITFSVVSGDNAIADRVYRVRPGYQYRIQASNTGALTYRGDDSAAGGTGYFNQGTVGSLDETFVATSSTFYFRAFTSVDARTLDSVTLTEVAAGGDRIDLLDTSRMFSDDGNTPVTDGDTVKWVYPKGRASLFGTPLISEPLFQTDSWTATTGGTINSETQFTMTQAGGIRIADASLSAGTAHRFRIVYTSDVNGAIRSGDGGGGDVAANFSAGTDQVVEGNVRVADGTTSNFFYIRLDSAGTMSVSEIELKPINGYPFWRSVAGDRPEWVVSGGLGALRFDGTSDFLQAIDPDGDLAITGDLTVISACASSNLAAPNVIVSSGTTPANLDTAFQQYLDTSGNLTFFQADASAQEAETIASGITARSVAVLSDIRSGASVTHGALVKSVETDTFSGVTTPTAGATPATRIGVDSAATGSYFAGDIYGLLIIDRALTTGLTVMLERAQAALLVPSTFTLQDLYEDGTYSGFLIDPNVAGSMFTDDQAATVAGDSDTVAVARDQSGNGIDFGQTTVGNRPILTLNSDGVYSLDPAGGGDALISAVAAWAADDDITTLAAVELDQASSDSDPSLATGNIASSEFGYRDGFDSTNGYPQISASEGGTANAAAGATWSNDRDGLADVRAMSWQAGGDSEVRVNGAQRATAATPAYATIDAAATVSLFGRPVSSLNYLAASVRLVMLLNKRLDPREQHAAEVRIASQSYPLTTKLPLQIAA